MVRSQCDVRRRRWREAFSLLETVVSSVLVGVLLVAVLKTMGASVVAQYQTGERAQAALLADGLIAEIAAMDYENPDGMPTFGLESGEQPCQKATFDDVDDFDGWTETPPQFADGTAMPDLAGWTRTVQIARVHDHDLAIEENAETGVKRITVTVRHNGRNVAKRIAYRSKAP
jgi:type II secretory pathway pseudopilin PulG